MTVQCVLATDSSDKVGRPSRTSRPQPPGPGIAANDTLVFIDLLKVN